MLASELPYHDYAESHRLDSQESSPDLQRNLHSHRFPVTHHRDIHRLSRFMGAQHVREVFQGLDIETAKSNQGISAFESGFGRRAVGPNIGKTHSLDLVSHIRNRAEE